MIKEVRVMRRSFVAVALMFSSLVTISQPAAAAPTVEFPVHQWNLQVNSSTPTMIKWFVGAANPKPFYLSFQEVCKPIYDEIVRQVNADDMPTKYFALPFAPTSTANGTATKKSGTCNQDWFGNALLLIGPRDGSSRNGSASYTNLPQNPNSNEPRKMACQPMSTLVGKFMGCTTHLDTYSKADTGGQAKSAHDTANFLDGAIPGLTSVEADWNLELFDAYMDIWRNDYLVTDGRYATHPASNKTEYIDLAFGKRIDVYGTQVQRDTWCNTAYSDHCYDTSSLWWY